MSDEAVREVARSTIAAWTRAALAPQGRGGSGEGGARTAAAESLRGTAFAAGVECGAGREDLYITHKKKRDSRLGTLSVLAAGM